MLLHFRVQNSAWPLHGWVLVARAEVDVEVALRRMVLLLEDVAREDPMSKVTELELFDDEVILVELDELLAAMLLDEALMVP